MTDETKPIFFKTERLGFRYTHDEYYEPTGLQHPSYLMAAADYARSSSV